MTVEELIHHLKDCRPDAHVFKSLFDDGSDLRQVKGILNQGNYVVLFKEIAHDSPNYKLLTKKFGK